MKLSGHKADWWGPEVRDTNGDWKPMNHPSWATNPDHYVVSYHVEPGHKVQFRMQAPKTSHYELSCWFTHPAGVEQCDGTETFKATFAPKAGPNEEVSVVVDATHPIAPVRLAVATDSHSVAMTRAETADTWQWWGHIPDGTLIFFWTSSLETDDYASSPCYRWPTLTQVACPEGYPSSAGHPYAIDGDWSRMRAHVSEGSTGDPGKVEVRFDGGAWQTMTQDKAANTATLSGAPASGAHRAQFRTTSPAGEVLCDEEGWQWPYSTSYPQSAPFAFAEFKGNENWVQTNVYSPKNVIAVEAQVNRGAWQPLDQQPYCDWAKGISAPAGSAVRFRAVFSDLGMWQSEDVTWPPGTADAPFNATFQVSGGSNLMSVKVDATHPVSDVWYLVNGGWGNKLTKQADGSWARSGYVPSGVTVRFQAIGPTEADTARSGCYRWPTLAPVSCDPGWDPSVVWVDGSTDHSRVYASVASWGTPEVAKVQVRFDGGTFVDMTRMEGGGAWEAGGAPTTDGHVAEFRVTGSDGQVVCDEKGYKWYPSPDYDPVVETLTLAEPKGTSGWVQVNAYGRSVVAVEAQVNGGAWQPLALQSYCDWAKAISVPSGSTVRFRAFDAALASVTGPAMAWPPSGGGTTPPPPSGGSFDATFSGVKGNEWWVQSSVAATGGTLAKVDVSLNGGAWKPLANKGWGWAASYSIPSGTLVQLRATSTTGATDLSGCYKWTAATAATCPSGGGTTPPPANSTFDATFKNVKGNDWWLQTDVSTTGGTLFGVEARINGGTWVALTKQSWGSWAKSVHAPEGSSVEFRARSTEGATDLSGVYRWPPPA